MQLINPTHPFSLVQLQYQVDNSWDLQHTIYDVAWSEKLRILFVGCHQPINRAKKKWAYLSQGNQLDVFGCPGFVYAFFVEWIGSYLHII